jgi:hypothetical protein
MSTERNFNCKNYGVMGKFTEVQRVRYAERNGARGGGCGEL